MFNLGSQELLIIAGVIMVLFGGSKIPELMRGIGSGVREFKTAIDSKEPSREPDATASKEEIKS